MFHVQIDDFYKDFLEHLGPEASEQLNDSLQSFYDYLIHFNRDFEKAHGWRK